MLESEISVRIPRLWDEKGWLEPKWDNIVSSLQKKRFELLQRHGLQEPLARKQMPHANNATIQNLGHQLQPGTPQGQPAASTAQGQGKQPVPTGDDLLRGAVMNNAQVQGQQLQSQRLPSCAGPSIPRQEVAMNNVQAHGHHSAGSGQSQRTPSPANRNVHQPIAQNNGMAQNQSQVSNGNIQAYPSANGNHIRDQAALSQAQQIGRLTQSTMNNRALKQPLAPNSRSPRNSR